VLTTIVIVVLAWILLSLVVGWVLLRPRHHGHGRRRNGA
jgi:hypothetical protein